LIEVAELTEGRALEPEVAVPTEPASTADVVVAFAGGEGAPPNETEAAPLPVPEPPETTAQAVVETLDSLETASDVTLEEPEVDPDSREP